jgi:hypothetical protein
VLEPPAADRLDAHLSSCAECRRFAATAEATATTLRGRARAAAEGRDWDRVRAGFVARRRLDRRRKLGGLASFFVMGAMGWWAMGPAHGALFAAFVGAIGVFVHVRLFRPEERLARRAEAADADVLDFYRRDLDKEIRGLRGGRLVLLVLGILLASNLLLMVAAIATELARGRPLPNVESYVATGVVFTVIGAVMWLRGRRALPRLERERAELGT